MSLFQKSNRNDLNRFLIKTIYYLKLRSGNQSGLWESITFNSVSVVHCYSVTSFNSENVVVFKMTDCSIPLHSYQNDITEIYEASSFNITYYFVA